jgi:transcriptional regulator with XRE-family HTH domain
MNKKFYKEIGNTIKIGRAKKSITQQRLADLAGYSRQTIAKIELGHQHINLEQLDKIYKLLDIKLHIELPQNDL